MVFSALPSSIALRFDSWATARDDRAIRLHWKDNPASHPGIAAVAVRMPIWRITQYKLDAPFAARFENALCRREPLGRESASADYALRGRSGAGR